MTSHRRMLRSVRRINSAAELADPRVSGTWTWEAIVSPYLPRNTLARGSEAADFATPAAYDVTNKQEINSG
jgi:hypothetical protein